MPELDSAMGAMRVSLDELVNAANRCASTWTTPRAPGKWTPSQEVEHVALILEESGKAAVGQPAKFPKIPAMLRPLMRTVFFNRILKTGRFPKVKTRKVFDPESGPANPEAAKARLLKAMEEFDGGLRKRAAQNSYFVSTAFGNILLTDYLKFQEIHTRHHAKLMTGGK